MSANSNLSSEIISRFRNCDGKPVCRASDKDQTRSGVRGKGECIICKKMTNWYCIKCRNFACHDRTKGSIKYVNDANADQNGNHIMALNSCFIACHPNFL